MAALSALIFSSKDLSIVGAGVSSAGAGIFLAGAGVSLAGTDTFSEDFFSLFLFDDMFFGSDLFEFDC